MRDRLKTPYGWARIAAPDACLSTITAETTAAAWYAQGYMAGHLRGWQLDLTRRVAAGRLSALFGPSMLGRDRMQRSLGLTELARRDATAQAKTRQGEHVRAYVAGIGQAWVERPRPGIEFAVLATRPAAYRVVDAYLVGHLKFFINTTWRFELLQTLICARVGARRTAALFSIEDDGGALAEVGGPAAELWGDDAMAAVRDAAGAMSLLGLDAPDIGSNLVAVGGRRTRSGHPLLANDPHMGQVVPAYCMMCHVRTDDGLDVRGAHFPGTPGIFIGRTPRHAWGMAGVMADNQDLFWGRLQGDGVVVAGSRRALVRRDEPIRIRGARAETHTRWTLPSTPVGDGRTAAGRMILRRGGRGLFLRWPALERAIGDLTLEGLARARSWRGFRRALSGMRNTPLVAAYADARQIGLQVGGDLPERDAPIGGLVLGLDRVEHQWRGYAEALPSRGEPAAGLLVHSNHLDPVLLAGGPHVGTRWHPPTRARRIAELLGPMVDMDDLERAQDDRIDAFARDTLPGLLRQLDGPLAEAALSAFGDWRGDTRMMAPTMLFERWFRALAVRCTRDLPPALAGAWLDEWPAWRWVVRRLADRTSINGAFVDAIAASEPAPRVAFRHPLRRLPVAGRLFGTGHRFEGGSRETVHVARRSLDFVTAGHAPGVGQTPYCFGPAFKLTCDLAPGGVTRLACPLPNAGTPTPWRLRSVMARWRRGERIRWDAEPAITP